jgi:hypothetical protein
MREVEFHIPSSKELTRVDSSIESACSAEGLQIGMRGTLATFPGSIHWHFNKPGERGTLEITLFPRDRRIWAQIQAGRRADWIEPCLKKIKQVVEEKLKEATKPAS